MTAVRSWAVAALVLLAAYHALRVIAGACTGSACDAFIGPSLVLPVAILVSAGVAGAAAASAAGGSVRMMLLAATLLSTAGPLVALAFQKDSPDTLVPAATLLFVISPAAALVYSFRRPTSPPPSR